MTCGRGHDGLGFAAAGMTCGRGHDDARGRLGQLAGPRQPVGWLGGPQHYVQKHGHPRLRMRHAPFPIGDAERDQWLECMTLAMDELGLEGELRAFLDARFTQVADFMRNRG